MLFLPWPRYLGEGSGRSGAGGFYHPGFYCGAKRLAVVGKNYLAARRRLLLRCRSPMVCRGAEEQSRVLSGFSLRTQSRKICHEPLPAFAAILVLPRGSGALAD